MDAYHLGCVERMKNVKTVTDDEVICCNITDSSVNDKEDISVTLSESISWENSDLKRLNNDLRQEIDDPKRENINLKIDIEELLLHNTHNTSKSNLRDNNELRLFIKPEN